MTAPLVSIVLPTYNGARYLPEALESCLGQSFTDWELIVVDDASTDQTPQIVAAFAERDSRIRSVRHPDNRKLPAALNSGFALARGAYLTWTSDDNIYLPEALELMLAALEQDGAAAGVCTGYQVIDELGRRQQSVSAVGQQYLVLGNSIGPCFLYRKSAAQAVGPYDEGLFLVEDYDFWLRFSYAHRMVALQATPYLYRSHGASLSSQKEREVARLHAALLIRSLPLLRGISRRQRVAGWLAASSISLQVGEHGAALLSFARALTVAPFSACRYLFRIRMRDRGVLEELVQSPEGGAS